MKMKTIRVSYYMSLGMRISDAQLIGFAILLERAIANRFETKKRFAV